MENSKISLKIIKQYLETLTPSLIGELQEIMNIKFSAKTKLLDFEIFNHGHTYGMVCWPMANQNSQTENSIQFDFIHNLLNTGIIIPPQFLRRPDRFELDWEIYKFCDENDDEIITIIANWFSNAWDKADKMQNKLPAFVCRRGKSKKFDLQKKVWV